MVSQAGGFAKGAADTLGAVFNHTKQIEEPACPLVILQVAFASTFRES